MIFFIFSLTVTFFYLKVKLIEPVLKNNPHVKLNKDNNLEFELTLNANKTEEVTIKYSVDHPGDKEIEFH